MAYILLIVASFAICSADPVLGQIGEELQKNVVAVAHPIEETASTVISRNCDNVKKLLGASYQQIENRNEIDFSKLTLEYRDPGITTIFNLSTAAERIPQATEYDPAQNLYVYIHGFNDGPSGIGFSTVNEALLSDGQSNVLALDASSLIKTFYLRSSTLVRFIGRKLGEVLAAMANNIFYFFLFFFFIIGHSLGAHISSFTGKAFANLTGVNVGRITGLDPAGPCFADVDPELRLKSTDADFVDVIHTNAGVLGIKDAVGQVDYYPNSGAEQPNCGVIPNCDHSRAWRYFAESVRNQDAFLTRKCEDYDAFKKGQCGDDISPMGFASKPGTTGVYYLQTAGNSPYGLGEQGLTWQNNQGLIKNVADKIFGKLP